MNSLVIYHSQFGNTKTIADIIGAVLKSYGPAGVLNSAEFGAETLDNIDVLVVGGPTQAHGTSPAIKPFLSALLSGPARHIRAAAFDTRLRGPLLLWGSAAKATGEALEGAGFQLVVPPESFFVKGMNEPHLAEGEYEHAKVWALEIAKRVESAMPVASRTP